MTKFIYSRAVFKKTIEALPFRFSASLYIHCTSFLKANIVLLTPLPLFQNFSYLLLSRLHPASEYCIFDIIIHHQSEKNDSVNHYIIPNVYFINI